MRSLNHPFTLTTVSFAMYVKGFWNMEHLKLMVPDVHQPSGTRCSPNMLAGL